MLVSRTSSRKFGDLITKFFVKDVNLETIIDMLSWYKIWRLNGFNLNRANENISGNTKRTYQSSWSRRGNQTSFTKTIRIWIAERAVRRIKEGTYAVLLLSGLDEKWWADSMECYCFLRNTQELLSDGKTPYERRFGMPFNGPIIPFGSMVEYHPISAKDLSRHQFGPKVLPGIFFGYVSV